MTRRILIIDDEPRWLEFAQRDLIGRYEVAVAKDAAAALEKLRVANYDLVIASTRRLDVVEQIRREYADKPIMVMTIRPTTQEASQVYGLGATRYVSKSFGPSDLYHRVRDLFQVAPALPV
jgi:two-component system, OmpR family, KDP operon response regulator KdpE